MSLPEITNLAGAWAELVAFSPVLSSFDSGDVEILNDDIPEYNGPAGIIGTVLALLMVAIGAVKRIYQVNENALSRRDATNQFDSYLKVANFLDKQQCASLFLCLTAFQSGSQNISLQKQLLLHPFSSNSSGQFSQNKLSKSAKFGFQAACQQDCSRINPECPFTPSFLEGVFHRTLNLKNKMLLWLQSVLSKNLKLRRRIRGKVM